jgi:hypothetical protein
MTGNSASHAPEICELHGKLFHSFPDIVFRQAEADQTAVMAFRLGDKEATLPLSRIGGEFGIKTGSPDAKMIELITTALEFVTCLRLGDRLPAEVVTGLASWTPKSEYRLLAEARLRMQLIAWLTPSAEQVEASGQTLLTLAEDPLIRAQAQEAMARAAKDLGFANAQEVLARMEDLATELSYLEHLRACFLDRLDAMDAKIGALAVRVRAGTGGYETVSQVRKLLAAAKRKIHGRFEDLDAQTGEIIAALRNLDQQRAFIRAGRDWLYRNFRGFEPYLDRFDQFDAQTDQDIPSLLNPLYHFLAPRFMPATEWLRILRPEPKVTARVMSW